jgi:hypothetical protein
MTTAQDGGKVVSLTFGAVINWKIKCLERKVLWLCIAAISVMNLYGIRETTNILAKNFGVQTDICVHCASKL